MGNCIALLCWDERGKGPLWERAPAVSATHCQCSPLAPRATSPRYGESVSQRKVFDTLAFPLGGRWPGGPDEGGVCEIGSKWAMAARSALISPLRGQLQSPRQEPPPAVALRHAPAGAAPRGKPFKYAPKSCCPSRCSLPWCSREPSCQRCGSPRREQR